MFVGQYVEIKPAFTMDGPLHDEVTAMSGWIREIGSEDVLFEARGTGYQFWITPRRIKPL